MKLSIVVPVYNEASTVCTMIDKVRALELDKEIIVVNDGSSDGTREALSTYEQKVASAPDAADIRFHHNLVNLGKGASVRIGFTLARGDIVTVQDADLELDPDDFYRLIAPIVDGTADVVYGSRFMEAHPDVNLAFYWANRALTGLTNLLYGAHLTDIETCYKLFRRDVLYALTLRASRFEIEPEITAQVLKRGYRIAELPIGYRPRSTKEKKISWQDGFAAVHMLLKQRLMSR